MDIMSPHLALSQLDLERLVRDSVQDAQKSMKAKHGLEAWLTWVTEDKNERITEVFSQPSKSYVKAFLQFICLGAGLQTITITDTIVTGRSVSGNSNNLFVAAGLGNDNYGILVGTGTTAVNAANTALATKIPTGSTGTQLNYQAMVVNVPAVSGSDTTMLITRGFQNASGSSITINEVGLACTGQSTTQYFLIMRDLSTIAVANGSTSTCNYTLKTTV